MTTSKVFGNTTLTSTSPGANYLFFNDYLRRVGGTISVKNDTTNAPPGSPSQEDAYIVGPSPSGAWSGLAGRIVMWYGGGWKVMPNMIGFSVHNLDLGAHGECYASSPLSWFYPRGIFQQTISTTQEILLNTGKYGSFFYTFSSTLTLTLNVSSPVPGHLYTVVVLNSGAGASTVTLKTGSWLRVASSYVVNATKYTVIAFTRSGNDSKGVAHSIVENAGLT